MEDIRLGFSRAKCSHTFTGMILWKESVWMCKLGIRTHPSVLTAGQSVQVHEYSDPILARPFNPGSLSELM
jgi:hypothetical protein